MVKSKRRWFIWWLFRSIIQSLDATFSKSA